LQQSYANKEALAHYERALAVCDRSGIQVDPAVILTLYAGKGTLLLFLSQPHPAIEAYQRMLEVTRQCGNQVKEAEALQQLSLTFYLAHEFEQALATAEQAKTLALALDSKNILAGSFLTMSLVRETTGKIDEAIRLSEQSLRLSSEAGDKNMEGLSLVLLGMLRNFRGEYDPALRFQEQAFVIGQDHLLVFPLIWSLWTQSLSLCGRGEYDKALESLRKALELSTRLDDKVFRCRILNTYGWVYGELHHLDAAMKYNQEGVELSYTVNDPEIIRNAELNLGDNYLFQGNIEQARQCLEKVYRDSQQRGKWGEEYMKWRYMQHCCHSLGELWLLKGDSDKALRFADECLQLAEPTESRKNIVKGWRLQGQAYSIQGRLAEAEAVLQKALTLAKEIGNPPQLWKTYQALGELYEKQSATDQARSAYASAIEMIEGVASQLQDQAIQETFLAARPVQELRGCLERLTPP
jgi:tetratricopeptide (TPR) repeat protein